jgi:hypothetical protein
VNASSLGQHPIEFDDVTRTRGYTGGHAYAQSKLATPVSTVEEGAILNPATSEELAGRSGDFYNGLRSAKPNAQAYDDRARQ